MTINHYNKKNKLNSQRSKEEPYMLLITLPMHPGTDLSNRLLLQNPKMKDIVIREPWAKVSQVIHIDKTGKKKADKNASNIIG